VVSKSQVVVATVLVAVLSGLGGSVALADPPAQPGPAFGLSHRPVCLPAGPNAARCHADVVSDAGGRPLATTTYGAGYAPADLAGAYRLTAGGSGQTVAIVDAYDNPNAESDLAAYRSQFGLAPCTTANGCFRKVDQRGGTAYPAANVGWGQEISLDLDMVSAVCPGCRIVLVVTDSNAFSNLAAGVDRAAAMGATAISNSYGGSEFSGEASWESHYNHPGTAITVSSGDNGYGVEYPAASRYVTAVGGTSLNRSTATTRGWTEAVWSGAGSGCSSYITKPSWQTDGATCARRTVADVAAVADPATGVAVYDTYGGSGWAVYGGTSASSPIIAGVYALAGTPGSSDYPAKYPYSHTSNLYDVTSGNNGSCSTSYFCTAGTGYDGPTGWGTPDGTAAFTSGTTTGNTVTVTNPGSQSTVTGSTASLQISASDSASATLTYSASGLPTGLSISSSTGLISGTASTAGTYAVTVTATDSTGASGSASFTWTVSTSGGGSCTSTQLLGNAGFESGNTTWTASSGVITNSSSEAAHAGSYYAWLDGYGSTHTDTLSQSVTVPSGCTATTFTFYLHVDTAETSTSTAYDKLTVTAGSTTLATYSNLNAASGYVAKSFSLSAFAGTTVTLKFSGVEDSSLQTSFVVDDTAVTTG
jgi:subtilase family serine protease